VHIRWLAGSIGDWPALFKEAFRCLKPGGWIESSEPSSRLQSDDGSLPENSAMIQCGKFFVEGGKKIGRPFTVFEDELQRKGMADAGFVDIEEQDFKVGDSEMPDVARKLTVFPATVPCWSMA
jgi:hypothetical protein